MTLFLALALRNVFRNRVRTAVALLAIATGCAALIVNGGVIYNIFRELREDLDWVVPKLVPHPYRTLIEPVQLRGPADSVPRTYINCIGDKARGGPRTPQAQGIDDYHELSTGHDAMITAPEEVAELLLQAVSP